MSLLSAVGDEDLEQVQKLLAEEYDVDEEDHRGWTPLIYAVVLTDGHQDHGTMLSIVEELVQAGANIHHKDQQGWSAYHRATSEDYNLSPKLKAAVLADVVSKPPIRRYQAVLATREKYK